MPTTTFDTFSPGTVVRLHDALATAAAVTAAVELGVLDRIDRGPAHAAVIAEECGLSRRGTELLLSALAGIGLIRTAGDGHYVAAADPRDVSWLVETWSGLPAALCTGGGVAAAHTPQGAAALYPNVVPRLAVMFADAAERAADFLAAPNLRVLDVGAGGAPWSIALAKRTRTCRVTAVDLPAVLPVTARSVHEAALDADFKLLAGDMFSVDWGTGLYDLVLAGNVCHLFDEQTNRRLLARLREALRPGGTVALIDVLPDETLGEPPGAVLYALGLLLRTADGRAYPFSAYERWLSDAGFIRLERHELASSPPLSLLVARSPA
jgi:SAM-dependent methyltransferase